MKLSRLRGRKVCDRVLRLGRVWKGRTMLIRFVPGAPRDPRVHPDVSAVYIGLLASAKLHKSAVVRNRMRRRCREAWRIVLQGLESVVTVQLLISPRSSSLEAPFADIQRDVRTFLSSLPSSWPPLPPSDHPRSSSSR